MRRHRIGGLLAGGLLLLSASLAHAQMGGGGGAMGGTGGFGGGGGFAGGTGGFSGGTGGFGGGTGATGGGGFAGTAGGFAGSTGFASSGGFSGGTGGTFTGTGGATGGTGTGITGMGAGFAGGRAGQVTTNSVFGRFLGNPLAMGMVVGTNARGAQLMRQYPVALSFGQPLYGTAALTTNPLGMGGLGTTGLGTTGLGTTGLGTANRLIGGTSVGIRRAPGYIAEPAFAVPPRPVMASVRSDLQTVIARSSRLPSRDNIQVLAEGDTIVLRGRVASERERRLAEGMLRLSPGVRQVRNELQVPGGAAKSP